MAKENRFSDLPDSVLIHILSMMCKNSEDSKEVVRTSVLSKQWQFLWKSVPVPLDFYLEENLLDDDMQEMVNFTHRELHYFRSFDKIRKLELIFDFYKPEDFVEDIDLWIYFATELGKVEDLILECECGYEFPQFAYKNATLRNLDLRFCTVNPLANVNWSGIVSLSFSNMCLKDGVMKKILSGCPNLECLKLYDFHGLHRLRICNVKLRKLVIKDFTYDDECGQWLVIIAPHIKDLEILGLCRGIRLRNVDSLVTAVLDFVLNFEEDKSKRKSRESTCLKYIFHSVAHIKKLELGCWCSEYLSILELDGWQPQPSTWKFLQLSTTLRQLDFPGISSYLQSSSHLETLVIDGDNESRAQLLRYTSEDEQIKRFERHDFSGSFRHLRTIEILDFSGSMLPFVEYLLKHASVLEKFVIVPRSKSSDAYVEIVEEFLHFPRSSSSVTLCLKLD
ncbi:F-box protein At5g03100-like [Solanum lycopersicum]|uniref:F-box protein At5g03100-like n=1 Tax=Solanum lycopersicum TaxID=4081 RepID=UPI003748195E